ncbi:hypothetical protein LCGC14_1404860 [marine sediment metagenome]|uniref:Terminase large subunit gp17-like C-terminal domain-containing protein n=1 Tax=marine sediment metagenome TaxID=412755 RepID=A0A0F9MXJ8_9ZZZZ
MNLPAQERRSYIESRLHSDWGWVKWEKTSNGRSVRQIADAIARAYPEHKRPSHMTVDRDIKWLIEKALGAPKSDDEAAEAERLLEPENFAEWRAKIFTTPEGKPYELPIHQKAAFWIMYCMTYKVAIPKWVITWLDMVDPDRPLPTNLNEMITGGKHFLSFELLMAPRHGKTDLVIHFIIWVHCKSPNRRIMFGNGTEKKTHAFIANFIMPVLETHEKLNELYGPFRGTLAWAKDGYILAQREGYSKMPSLQPFGLRGSVRSFDTDLVVGDDLSDYKRAISETTTELDAEWVRTELMSRREMNSPFFNFGSHLPIETGDLFIHIEDKLESMETAGNQVYIVKKIPAHNYANCHPEIAGDPASAHGEWCLLWPSIRDWHYLEGQRQLMADDVMFEAVFNQVPLSKSMMHFPKDNVRSKYLYIPLDDGLRRPVPTKDMGQLGILDYSREWKVVPTCCMNMKVLVAMGFDPAYSKKKTAAFTAISVKGACPYCGRRYLIDWWEGRESAELHPTTAKPEFRRVVDGLAGAWLDGAAPTSSRVDRLRVCGNGVVPQAAALAFAELLKRACS